MGIISVIVILFCLSSGTFAIGAASGGKIGGNYKSEVIMKAAFIFAIAALVAMGTGFLVGRLAQGFILPITNWIPFVFLFLMGIRLILESMEKPPSLKYTDIVRNKYLLQVAMQASMDVFFLGFVIAGVSANLLLGGLVFCGILAFFSLMTGFSHGVSNNKSVLGNRAELVSGIILLLFAVKFLIAAYN
jgi:putative Mn2+ efflux pump MntP